MHVLPGLHRLCHRLVARQSQERVIPLLTATWAISRRYVCTVASPAAGAFRRRRDHGGDGIPAGGRRNVTYRHLPSLTVTCRHLPSLTVAYRHLPSPTVTHRHPPLPAVITSPHVIPAVKNSSSTVTSLTLHPLPLHLLPSRCNSQNSSSTAISNRTTCCSTTPATFGSSILGFRFDRSITASRALPTSAGRPTTWPRRCGTPSALAARTGPPPTGTPSGSRCTS